MLETDFQKSEVLKRTIYYRSSCLVYKLEINFSIVLWTFQKTKKEGLSIELIDAKISKKKNLSAQFKWIYMDVDSIYLIWPA